MLGIVYRVVATHLIGKAGLTGQHARTGAVTLIQRFGSALNLNLHFHMLLLDGVYVELRRAPGGALSFRWVKAPTGTEPTRLAQRIATKAWTKAKMQVGIKNDNRHTWVSWLRQRVVPLEDLQELVGSRPTRW